MGIDDSPQDVLVNIAANELAVNRVRRKVSGTNVAVTP